MATETGDKTESGRNRVYSAGKFGREEEQARETMRMRKHRDEQEEPRKAQRKSRSSENEEESG